MPTSILQNKIPFECLFGRLPDYKMLRIFGCQCFPWLKPYTTGKLHPKSTLCLFLGYSNSENAYKCMDLTTSRIYLFRHVVFDEYLFSFHSSTHTYVPTLPISGASSQDLDKPVVPPVGFTPPIIPTAKENHLSASLQTPQSPAITSSSTNANPCIPTRTHQMTTRSMNNIHKPKHLYLATKHPLPQPIEPTCFSLALKDPRWR